MFGRRKHRNEEQFLAILEQYRDIVAKVCYIYASDSTPFDDLYQEVLINIWQGMESYRGEAKMSTWIYRTAINTCISSYRRNLRHSAAHVDRLSDLKLDIEAGMDSNRLEEYHKLQSLISKLNPVDKAIISLWLDEKSYTEISAIIGISSSNVAVKLHRIKEKLTTMAREEE